MQSPRSVPTRVRPPLVAALGTAIAALAAAPAWAQSSVNLYGSLDVGAYSKQLSGENRLATLTSGNMNVSRWGIRGSEDLGDGLRARFDMSSYLRVDSGNAGRNDTDGFWARYAWVGLENAYGLLRAGRISTPNFINTIRFNPFVDSSLGPIFMHTYLPSAAQPLMTSDGVTDSAWSNSIAYSTPSLSGFEAALQVAAGEGTTGGRRVGVSGSYLSKTLSVGISYEDLTDMAMSFAKPPTVQPIKTDRATQLGISYDFQLVKLYAQYQWTKLENTGLQVKLNTGQVGALVPIGLGNLLVSYGHTTKDQTSLDDVKRDTVSVGYDYFLSKRTDLYAVALTDKATSLDRGNGFALGIRHNF